KARVANGLNQRPGGEQGQGRLAYRHDVHIALEIAHELNEIVDIVVEVEGAGGTRRAARIPPIRHIDLVAGKHVAHGAAQQRWVVAGHRRHDQQLRVLPTPRKRELPLEINEVAEGLGDDAAGTYGDLAP